MRDPGSSSSALWSKSTNVAGCPTVESGFGSFSSSSLAVESTTRKPAGCDPSCGRKPGSSALKSKHVTLLLRQLCRVRVRVVLVALCLGMGDPSFLLRLR